MSLLHCGLSTEQQIAEEEDVVWDWTKLFTEVVSVIMNDAPEDDPFSFNAEMSSTFGQDRNNELKEFEMLKSTRRAPMNKREIDF